METNCIEKISDFLGNEDERYFSSGFRYVNPDYESLVYQDKMLNGKAIVTSEWNRKSDKSAHLGTMV